MYLLFVCGCVSVSVYGLYTLNTFKSFGSVRFKKKYIYMFIQQGCIEFIKSDSKDIYKVTKYFYFK